MQTRNFKFPGQRIVWTVSERQAIAKKAAKIVFDFPGESIIAAVNRAQDSSPIEGIPIRRRPITSQASIGDELISMIHKELAILRRGGAVQPVNNPVMQAQEIIAQKVQSAEANLLDQVGKIIAPALVAAFRELMQVEVDRLKEEIRDEVYHSVLEEITKPDGTSDGTTDYPMPQATSEPRNDLPRVLVLGAKRAQAIVIEHKFRDQLNLVFAETNAMLRRANLKDTTVVQMTKFSDHLTSDIRSKISGLLYATGGISSVEECLNTILRRQARADKTTATA